MSNPVGRPMKYRALIEALIPDAIYCPASIVDHALDLGLLDPNKEPEALALERVRIRHTLSRYVTNHDFPEDGDGLVKVCKGQAPICGWFGWRWQNALPKPFIPTPKHKQSRRWRP